MISGDRPLPFFKAIEVFDQLSLVSAQYLEKYIRQEASEIGLVGRVSSHNDKVVGSIPTNAMKISG